MQIINAHVHMIELGNMLLAYPALKIPLELEVFKDLENTLALLKPDELLFQMDEAGVAKSVLFACEAPIVYSSNEYVADLCRKHPDRFIGFASVNPLRKDAVKIIESAVDKLGLKGIKFHPPLQNFYPNDKRVFPVYEKASQLEVPVVFHIGTTPFASLARLDTAYPILIDEVACAFPDLRIMLTHLGTLWHNEAFMVAEKNPNVFIDTSAYVYEIKDLLTKEIIQRVGEDKFIFGTDYPMPFGGKSHRMKDFVECLQSLDLSQETKEKVFFKNIELLLKGRQSKTIDARDLLKMIK